MSAAWLRRRHQTDRASRPLDVLLSGVPTLIARETIEFAPQSLIIITSRIKLNGRGNV